MTAWQRASDAELITAVRGDDPEAWAELCHRHLGAARRLARALVPAKAANELVTRASERVLADLRRGEGPDVALRPFFLAAVRSEQRSLRTAVGKDRPAVRSFHALPERSQLVLWHLDVEHDQPGEIAPLIGVAERAVQGIAGRARTGLCLATLDLYSREADELGPDCAWTREHLPVHVRGATTRRESARVAAHVQGCTPCASVHDELAAIDDDLAGILGPLVLGPAAADYLTTRRAGPAARHPGRVAVAGVAAAAALITGVALGLNGPSGDPTAEAPVLGSTDEQTPSIEREVTLEPLPSGEPGDDAPPHAPADSPTASGPGPLPTATSVTPSLPQGSPSDDSTISTPDTSGPPASPPPPTTPPPAVDPAVAAHGPTSPVPVAKVQVVVQDVAATDMRLTITAKAPNVDLVLDPRCTAMEGVVYAVCDLSEDASPIALSADLREVEGVINLLFGITPKPGVQESPAQVDNNERVLSLQAPLSED